MCCILSWSFFVVWTHTLSSLPLVSLTLVNHPNLNYYYVIINKIFKKFKFIKKYFLYCFRLPVFEYDSIWCEHWDQHCVGNYVVSSTCFWHKIEKNESLVPVTLLPSWPMRLMLDGGFFFFSPFVAKFYNPASKKKRGAGESNKCLLRNFF
jgi:hypothetical protein